MCKRGGVHVKDVLCKMVIIRPISHYFNLFVYLMAVLFRQYRLKTLKLKKIFFDGFYWLCSCIDTGTGRHWSAARVASHRVRRIFAEKNQWTALGQGLNYNKRLEWTQEEAIAYEYAGKSFMT